jgi:predicted ATP-dependent endonuclease of OLD family
VKNDSKSNMETDLTLFEDGIPIENKGRGKQCFIKTKFALGQTKKPINVVLLEEPENHLSHIKMQQLINIIKQADERQLFIATHNNLICSRLDLRKAIMLSNATEESIPFNNLNAETAKYFMKAADHNILEFVLAKKVILVEGNAEYMLMSRFFELITSKKESLFDINIIAVNGISFKRYLDLAKLLSIKTAVIRDNDCDYKKNCIENYQDYTSEIIQVFFENDNHRNTFEVTIYNDNTETCEKLFSSERRSLSVQDYMLKNKTEAAFALLKNETILNIPKYIKKAIEWIKK